MMGEGARDPRRRQRGFLLAWSLAAGLGASGCDDDAGGPQAIDAGTEKAGEIEADCVHKDDGVSCGSGQHCFGQRCVEDECGDGILSGDERCDDGNQDWGDGCSTECRPERPGCPDGELAGDEECDDGNWIDDDECSNRCLALNRCGNRRVEPGEDCDDGNVIDDDACTNDCLHFECGNGRLDPGEECDDGNIVDRGDGCTNACASTVCGNGKLEKYETCDDGNQLDGDGCGHDCVNAICGNGLVEPAGGEVCEGPRVLPADGNNPAGRRGCSDDCRQWVAEDPCETCQNQKCASYLGVNVVGGCFDAVDPNNEFGADPSDPVFIQRCIDLVDCAVVHGCGFTAEAQATECYCGAITPDTCLNSGPAEDAPCTQAWLAAARAETHSEMLERYQNLAFASGWAFYLIDCYRTECADVCVPPPLSSAP